MQLLALIRTIRFVLTHPLNQHAKYQSLKRYLKWQIGSRLVPGPVAVPFVGSSRLLVAPGMTGATGNIYGGLHEFEDMAFVLHALRETDCFIDVGANIGSYTILAGAVVQAECIAIEPIRSTFEHLVDNVALNHVSDKVTCLNIGVGAEVGTLRFTSDLDTTNHVAGETDGYCQTVEVPVKPLDEIAEGVQPTLIKIDVEGFEAQVIAGALQTLGQKTLLAVIVETNGLGESPGSNRNDTHQEMISYGFEPFSYHPFERGLEPLENLIRSGNTLYVRNGRVVRERLRAARAISIHGLRV